MDRWGLEEEPVSVDWTFAGQKGTEADTRSDHLGRLFWVVSVGVENQR